MWLTVIGCAGSFPSAESAASCYLVEHDGYRLLLDLGNGALGALQAHADPASIDAVLLSHLHVDHCIDLASYYVLRRIHPDGPLPRIPVHGPAGVAARMARIYDLPEDPGMTPAFEFRDWGGDGSVIEAGPFRVTTARVCHPVPCVAMRVEAGGRSLVYSGDTGPTDALVELARGADLALFEASFLEGGRNPRDLHLTARQAAEHAGRAGAGRLLLTHLVAWNDRDASRAEALAAYDGELELAATGLQVEV